MNGLDIQDLPRAAWPWVGGGMIALGALFVLFGDRLFKLLVALFGFLAGGAAAALFTHAALDPHPAVTLAAGLVAGVICATLFFLIYLAGVFALGAGVGAAGAAGVVNTLRLPPEPLYILVPAGVTGLLAVLLQRFVIVCGTSLAGAVLVLAGALLLRGGPAAWQRFQTPRSLTGAELLWVGGATLLAVLGIFVQYAVTGRRPTSTAPAEEAPAGAAPVRDTPPPPSSTAASTNWPTESHQEFARDFAPGLTSFHGADLHDGSGVEPDEAEIDAAVAEAIAVEQREQDEKTSEPPEGQGPT